MSKKTNYPEYPGSAWDYAVRESARYALRKPNKVICIYCHEQGIKEIEHKEDCPAKDEK